MAAIEVDLDERWAEMYRESAGFHGTWDEIRAFPNLADFECSACGSVSGHDAGCPKSLTIHHEQEEQQVPLTICKIEGCTAWAAIMAGPYAKLCARHAEEKKAARLAPAAVETAPPVLPNGAGEDEPGLASDLLGRVRELVDGDQELEVHAIIVDAEIAVKAAVQAAVQAGEEAIQEAAKQFAELLRQRLRETIAKA